MSDSLSEESFSTWEILKSLGFRDIEHRSDKLGFDFGHFVLWATSCINMSFQPVVMFNGIVRTTREVGRLEFEMPQEVDSQEIGLAWLTWCLDQQMGGMFLEPTLLAPWMEEGRKYRHILPWEIERAAYVTRPHCLVQRVWARPAIRQLAKYLETVDDDVSIVFQFDGEILIIRCDDKVLPMPATGFPWPKRYSLSVKKLRHLPKRLMREIVEFSIFDSALRVSNWCYSGVVELD